MYNCDFSCTYKDIENKYITESTTKELDTESDDVEDAYFLCEEIYRIEMLKCFFLEDFEEDTINTKIKKLFCACSNYPPLMEIIEIAKKCVLMEDTEMAFMFLFSYDLLYLTHPCIKQFILESTIDDKLLLHLKNGLSFLNI
jgi:hypothetical protein